MGIDELRWPRADHSRVPYQVFLDPELHAVEQARIFRGPVWLYLGLQAEIPKPGDYITTVAGDTPVVVVRADDMSIHAFVNRCAHRGTLLVRNNHGNAKDFTCVYHHWCYDHRGNLIGVPFLRGLKGKGGMPKSFKMPDHGLQRLRVDTYREGIFGTFRPDTESLVSFIDAPMCEYLDRMFAKPIEILGYTRQRIPGDWKLYTENTHDGYHAGLLHQMSTTFGLFRATEDGGIRLDKATGTR
jgi:anthranilate 1,2-dioxygenase large subunit